MKANSVKYVQVFLNLFHFSYVLLHVAKAPISTNATPEENNALPADAVVAEWELSVIETFVHASQLIGVPKSVGQIFGLLYCRENPLPMDSIIESLGISKGSASMGLKTLRQIGAVKTVFVIGDRRDHYSPELRLRKLVSGFISDQVQPHLDSGSERLKHMESLLEEIPEEQRKFAEQRIQSLGSWHSKMTTILPIVRKLL
ncbi:GbsR/MarR family transcriptional regulator [Cerasicoccus frondis]|uniref:GbsR/MarR family transcriptional regulator n=1 Tax=Cerasicoccus frondis TaxID=490090 RepID=UPI0028526342|nr:hypothetical protein [Cerasicoccus frondis]